MQAYSQKKSYATTCKCHHCRRGKHKRDGTRRALKKSARRQAKREIREDQE